MTSDPAGPTGPTDPADPPLPDAATLLRRLTAFHQNLRTARAAIRPRPRTRVLDPVAMRPPDAAHQSIESSESLRARVSSAMLCQDSGTSIAFLHG